MNVKCIESGQLSVIFSCAAVINWLQGSQLTSQKSLHIFMKATDVSRVYGSTVPSIYGTELWYHLPKVFERNLLRLWKSELLLRGVTAVSMLFTPSNNEYKLNCVLEAETDGSDELNDDNFDEQVLPASSHRTNCVLEAEWLWNNKQTHHPLTVLTGSLSYPINITRISTFFFFNDKF